MADRLCAQPAPFSPWRTEVKHSYISERRKPYRSASATCSASVRDGLRFAWHCSLQLTLWGGMQNSTRVLLWSYLGSFYQSLWICSWHWLEKEWEGRAACCPCQLVSALPTENVEQGEKYALWSQGPLIDKIGSHWFWGFAFFVCCSNREHWNSLPKLQGFHASKSGHSFFLSISDINWIG